MAGEGRAPEVLDAPEPVKGGLLEGLLADYKPKEPTFFVELPKGDKLEFRRLADGAEAEDLQRRAIAYASKIVKAKKLGKLSEEWQGVYVDRPDVIAKAFAIAQLALHPDLQSAIGIMRLYREAFPIFSTIAHQIDLASANMIAEAEREAYDEEGKG